MQRTPENANLTLGVLVTYFNERELLRSCIETALACAEPPDEVLVFDNASEYPASDYVPAGTPVRVIRNAENKGPSFGRNRLIEESRTDYVHFQDADDIFFPDWTSPLRTAFRNGGPDLVLNQVSVQRPNQEMWRDCMPFHELERKDLVRFSIENGLWTQCGTMKRSLLKQTGGFDETLWHNEDTDFYLRLALANPVYTVVETPLVLLQERGDSLSKKKLNAYRQSIPFFEKVFRITPKTHHAAAVEQLAAVGVALYRLGDRDASQKAVALAKSFGNPSYIRCGTSSYVRLVKWFGIENAERIRATWESMRGTSDVAAQDCPPEAVANK